MKSLMEKLNEKEEKASARYPYIPTEIEFPWEENRSLNEVLIYFGTRLRVERDNHLLGIFGRLKRFFKGRLYNSYDTPCGSGILNPSIYAMDALLAITGNERKFSKEKALGIYPTDEMKRICQEQLSDLISKYDEDIYGSNIIFALEQIYKEIKTKGDRDTYWKRSKETRTEIQERHELLKKNIEQIWNAYRSKHMAITPLIDNL